MGTETYAPLFTFFGSRYARVTLTGGAVLADIQMIPVTSVPVQAGGFTCGVAPVAEMPGFDAVTLDPLILPALSPVAAWHDCRHGRIEAGWTLTGDLAAYRVTLPAGCTGRLTAGSARRDVTLAGQPVTVPPEGLILPAGHHEITFRV